MPEYKLGLDVRTIGPRGTGIGRAMSEITKRLIAKLPHDSWEIHLIPGFDSVFDFDLPPNVIVASSLAKENSTAKRAAWFCPAYAAANKLDIFHSLDFLGPAWKRGFKLVQTIHDIIPALFPEQASWKSRFMCRHIMPPMFKSDDAVLVSSDNTGRDIVNMYNVDPKKITTVPLAGRDEFKSKPGAGAVKAVREKYSLKKDYFLFVGTLEPKKNVERIVDAYLSVPQLHDKYSLVLAGSRGWLVDSVFRKAAASRDIIFTGFIPDSDLIPLMHGAFTFVFPSVYEGFGLPVLDAMQSGVPVITSNSSSLREIAGDAAILVNPERHEEIASAMLIMTEHEDVRSEYADKGLARAAQYSWDKTADMIIKVYERLLKQEA